MQSIDAGDIGAGVGFKDIRTGDTLCSEEHPIVLESMSFPDTVLSIAVEPKSQADIAKLDNGLAKLAEEDPTFTVRTDEQSGQTIISGMGELHLDIIIDRLKREFKVECNQGKPQVNYKEAISRAAQSRETFKKQSGGRGKFACIDVTMSRRMRTSRRATCSLSMSSRVVTCLRSLSPLLRRASATASPMVCSVASR